ncbi:hypothetical protein [Salinigranum marinum]|uniref:hypothetical protein n=1 Tax=Salinigranum marinum TaxID=1515595 RepID=UPI002989ECEB|nr:hypothetical protein [Salinigranum marinum]
MTRPGGDRTDPGVAVALGVGLVVLAASGAFFLLGPSLAHPAAEIGVGGVTADAFDGMAETTDTHATRISLETRDDRTFHYLASTHGNGTTVRRYRPPSGAETDDLVVAESVTLDGTTYRRLTYRTASEVPAAASRPNATVDGNTVYAVGTTADRGAFVPLVADRVTGGLVYAEVGTVTRDGERLVRYDVIGERGGLPPLFESTATGFLLVNPDTNVVRYARVTAPDQDDRVTVTVRASGEPAPVPGWVDRVRFEGV